MKIVTDIIISIERGGQFVNIPASYSGSPDWRLVNFLSPSRSGVGNLFMLEGRINLAVIK
jgi:hypothetical protein